MTWGRLLLRNLLFHWRGNSAVLLGVAVGTAVLTGALLVGDSLRGSLRAVAFRQLGRVDQVLVANRLFNQSAARGLEKSCANVAPLLVLNGTVTVAEQEDIRAGRVNIYGVDDHFWAMWPAGQPPGGKGFWQFDKNFEQRWVKPEIMLNDALAKELGVQAGDKVVLNMQRASAVPRESVLGRREGAEVVDQLQVTVAEVLPAAQPGGRFNLNPGPTVPRNAFVPLGLLQLFLMKSRENQQTLGLLRPINAVLIAGPGDDLQQEFAQHLTLDDWGLVLRTPESRADVFLRNLDRNKNGTLEKKEWPRLNDSTFFKVIAGPDGQVDRDALVAYYRKRHAYSTLESRQLFVEDAVVQAAQRAAPQENLTAAPTLVYLADELSSGPKDEVVYAVVAALDPTLPPPLGPFLPKGIKALADDEIVLVDWPQSPLTKQRGLKKIKLTYYDPEVPDQKHTHEFRIAGWIPLQGAADDPDLTPEFPGITDKHSLKDWDPPKALHYDEKRLAKPHGDKSPDNIYWQNYRTTPKAYVNLATGQKLWGSRFGKVTSIRLATSKKVDLDKATVLFGKRLLAELQPEQGGFVFDAIRQRALESGSGGFDFGMLFLGFSIFIIASALVLVGLLFRLNLDRRAEEIGLLLAVGWRRGALRRLLLAEGVLLALVGGLLGSVAAVGYAWLLLEHLRYWWPGQLDRSFLQFHGTWQSFAIGYAAALAVSVLTIVWATRVLAKVAPAALLAGQSSDDPPSGIRKLPIYRILIALLAVIGAVVCIVLAPSIHDHEMQASTFFTSGFLLLVAGLIGVWWLLRRDSGAPRSHLATLGMSNAARHPTRSLLTAGLLASATFLIVAVESFHRDPGSHFLEEAGGSGGFALYGESDVPFFFDFDSQQGRDELDYALQLAKVPANERSVLDKVEFVSCRLRAGDDASCLNLAQPRRPRLLGVPHNLIERGGFQFSSSLAETQAEKDNPWLLLEKDFGPKVIPVIGETNTVAWMLKSGLGQDIEVPDETGQPVRLRFVALLQDSLFQSELVLSDANFRRLYPREGGYKFFLIAPPPGTNKQVRQLLERGLADHGLTVEPTRKRVEAYLEVENTYLATFQVLGGLGLLLGSLGLAVVLLRSVWERRSELALLRALGFRRSALAWLVLAENCYLLALGLGVGLIAALASVAPHRFGGDVMLWLRLAALLLLVVLVGLAAGALAVRATLRAPLVPALRRE